MRKYLLLAAVAIGLTGQAQAADHVTSYALVTSPNGYKVAYMIDDPGNWYEIDNVFPGYYINNAPAPNPMFDEYYAAIINAFNNGWAVQFSAGGYGNGAGGTSEITWLQVFNYR